MMLRGRRHGSCGGAIFSASLPCWFLGMIVMGLIFKREGSALAVAGISAGFSNLVLLGIPIISGVYGEEALFPLLMLLTVHLPVAMLVSSILVEWYAREEGKALNVGAALLNVGKGLVRNPIIVGIFAGGLWSLTGLDIPQVASVVIDKIAPVTVPLALMAMGMGMRRYGLRGDIIPGFILAFLKTMLFSGAVFVGHGHLGALADGMGRGDRALCGLPDGGQCLSIGRAFWRRSSDRCQHNHVVGFDGLGDIAFLDFHFTPDFGSLRRKSDCWTMPVERPADPCLTVGSSEEWRQVLCRSRGDP